MNFSAFVARRYLFSKKSMNVINIISTISVIGVATGTMALIIILSVYNGFENIIQNSFSKFDPDLKITAVSGKVFEPDSVLKARLLDISEIEVLCPVLEENVLLEYEEKMAPAVIKGVSDDFSRLTQIDSVISAGQYLLSKGSRNFCVPGYRLANTLGINVNFLSPVKVYVPKRTATTSDNPRNAFNESYLHPSGIFEIQMDYDEKYVLTDLDFARSILEYSTQVSAWEIGLKDNADADKVQKKVKGIMGEGYRVQNLFEQHEVLFRVMKSERWAIFMILSFIIIIAAFNIIGSLSMLIIEKKEDIKTLNALGLDRAGLEKVFFMEGWLISIIGAVIGLVLGVGFTLIQQHFGIIKIEGMIVDSYPVEFIPLDVLKVAVIVVSIGYLMSRFPVRYFIRQFQLQTGE